jgi:predicted negative regulator of RcsB-dependent stress response
VLWIATSFSSLALKWVIVDPIIALLFPTTWRYWFSDRRDSDSGACCCLHCLTAAFLKRGKVTDASAQGFSTVGP